MSIDFANKKAILITGASSGIGKACALHLEKLGFIIYAGVRKEKDFNFYKSYKPSKILPIFLDVRKSEDILNAFNNIASSGLELYALVNNAGISIGGPIELLPMHQVEELISINIIGVLRVTKVFIPLLRKSRGRIINIGSIAGRISVPGLCAYSSSKSALIGFSNSMRLELQRFGIAVSLIEPGIINTPIWEKGLNLANKSINQISKELIEIYKPIIYFLQRIATTPFKADVKKVAVIVAKAITSKRPRRRYLVGIDAKLLTFIDLLPRSVSDWSTIKLLDILN